jgi:hypothetical protein
MIFCTATMLIQILRGTILCPPAKTLVDMVVVEKTLSLEQHVPLPADGQEHVRSMILLSVTMLIQVLRGTILCPPAKTLVDMVVVA